MPRQLLIGHAERAAAAVVWLCLALLGCFASGGSASAQPAPPPPNVLLIQADDLGYGDLSTYGQARFKTPSLDRLAREGIRFTQYYAGSTVCAPSRTALMTGMHTGHAWIRGNGGLPGGDVPLRSEDVTVAEVLRGAGYRTAVIGKWGLGQPGSTGEPNKKGFEYAFGFLDHRHAHRQFTDHLWRNGERVSTDLEHAYVNDLFTKEAAAFIARAHDRAVGGRHPRRAGKQSALGALGRAADAGRARRRPRSRGARWSVDGACDSRCAAAQPRLLLLGVPRARLSAGGENGPLEGGAVEAR